jgi:hypothetical protein
MDTHCLACRISRALSDAGALERGFVIPTVPTDGRASDTSVASPYVPPDCRCAFALPYLAPPDALSGDGRRPA